jgi:DNA-binding Xre family transcriptional regulator
MATIELRVREFAEGKGISNPRELHLKSGVTYSVCYRMWYEASQTRLDLPALAQLCEALQCQPGDLLALKDGKPERKRKAKGK